MRIRVCAEVRVKVRVYLNLQGAPGNVQPGPSSGAEGADDWPTEAGECCDWPRDIRTSTGQPALYEGQGQGWYVCHQGSV